jgi:XTP/dITP diphosphohydrolase
MNSLDTKLQAFSRLLGIMEDLRAKCPWDKAQTLESLRHLTIEETYELSDAILKGDSAEVKKELGDLILHVVFYAKIGSETQDFDIADVLTGICEKLIKRHPHIYGDVQVKDEAEVRQNWERLKLKEGNQSVLSGVPASLPALLKAYRIQEKVRGVGFDWEEPQQVWAKVKEELAEFEQEYNQETITPENQAKAEMEFGDVLFALINYARFVGINPETALEKTNQKFTRRFQYIESKAKEISKSLADMTLAEMDVYWEEAKRMEDIILKQN